MRCYAAGKSISSRHLLGLLLNFVEHHGRVVNLGILQQGAYDVRDIHGGKVPGADYLQGKVRVGA